MTNTVLLALLKNLEGKVDSLETVSFEPVTELPETGEPNVIYLVPKSDPETGNYSDEYIWDSSNQTYEKIGDTQVSGLPEVTSADNGKILGVENGEWGKVSNNDANHNIASVYDSTVTYAVGDLCIYNGNLYECSTAISTAEAWDSTHWTQKTVAQELAGVGGASYVELGGKLLAGNNTLTFNDECITVGSIFEFYTDAYGVNPTDVSVTDGTLVLTFDIQQDNLKVKVRVWEDENPIDENI